MMSLHIIYNKIQFFSLEGCIQICLSYLRNEWLLKLENVSFISINTV